MKKLKCFLGNINKKIGSHKRECRVADDNALRDAVLPPSEGLPHDELFTSDGNINLEVLKSHLQREGRLLKEDALSLISRAAKIFRREPTLLVLSEPITVCGDIHGQFYDLVRLVEAAGDPAKTQYLFLGDYVDRGSFSTECVFYLFAHKMKYPESFWMLRGNHECRQLTEHFNFKTECIYKYDNDLYLAFMDAFDCLPVAATIQNKFLAVHGGLSPDITVLDDINKIDRFQEIPYEGPLCDLVWSDPLEDGEVTWFTFNEKRQCSYQFGEDAVTEFLKKNNLTAIIRAHEAVYDGYRFQHLSEETLVPQVITIFSAPNYCDFYKNKAAFLTFVDDQVDIKQFDASPHPYILPNFMDVFTWSMPFIAESACSMLNDVLSFTMNSGDCSKPTQENEVSVNVTNPDLVNDAETVEMRLSQEKKRRIAVLREKVIAVSKMMKLFNVVRTENDTISKLKMLHPSGKLPSGLLSQGSKAITDALYFARVAEIDLVNEQLPLRTQFSLPELPARRSQLKFRNSKYIKSKTLGGW